MPYDPKLHKSLPYIDSQYKELLDKLSVAHKRSIKDELEVIIMSAAKKEKLTTQTNDTGVL